MRIASIILLGFLLVNVSVSALAKTSNEIVVDGKGNGNFTTIQAAINSLPRDGSERIRIYIRNGLYNEKVSISRGHLILQGENRDSTRIIYPILRETWSQGHNGSDWGAGVLNIDTGISDIILANLTVYNNYGSLFGAYNNHQFAIRGNGTRIILLRCNVLSDGGDALSLWDRHDGMYYHYDCRFEGWVDFVCPRGWCYIADSKFFGHNTPSASIWHDGSSDKHQKFVIVNSNFDGVAGFPLGRNHLDGQFYLIGCTFSANMANKPFIRPASSPKPWAWGDRHYFYHCHREGGDYDWFKDNLDQADGSPTPEKISPVWTFDGRWDPESDIAGILPDAIIPKPGNSEKNIPPVGVTLRWIPGRSVRSHNVYFGTEASPPFKGMVTSSSFIPGLLLPNTKYYWRVDEVVDSVEVKGDLWSFTTGSER